MFIVKRNRSLSPTPIDSTFFKPYEILNSKTEILNKSKSEHSNSKPGWGKYRMSKSEREN